jgi:hypothetical protein
MFHSEPTKTNNVPHWTNIDKQKTSIGTNCTLNHAQAYIDDWKLRSYLKSKKFEVQNVVQFYKCEIWTLHKIDAKCEVKIQNANCKDKLKSNPCL